MPQSTCAPRVWLWAGTLLALLGACESAPPAVDPAALRQLGQARIDGFQGRYGNHAWLGLRYAQAPLGEYRFRAPRPAQPHSQRALQLGSPCPQLAHPLGIDDASAGTLVGQEDCLFLNVYAPKLGAQQASQAALPVMVWLHGGGNVVGHGGAYEPGNLAQRERVLVVTLNHRLGPLGWFRHRALAEGTSAEDGSGNYGTLDVIAALRWVREHIAGFGGAPDNVTIFGESAGARNVLSLLLAPGARGLFQRAIAQSGNARVQDARSAEAFSAEGGHINSSNQVLARLLVADGRARDAADARAQLERLSAPEIARYLRGKSASALLSVYVREEDEALPAVPSVIADGSVLPLETPLALFERRDAYAPVPVMLGTNRDESKTFLLFKPAHVRRFTRLYMRLRDPERYDALAQALSLGWKLMGADAPAQAIARSGGQVYVYRFDWDEEPTLLGADFARMLGAGHGMEIPFVFGHFKLQKQANLMFGEHNRPGRMALSGQMMAYWAEFARSGKPGAARQRGAAWKPFGAAAGERHFMVFDTPAGGGTRLSQGALDVAGLIARVDGDRRLRDQRERCAVFHELVRSVPLLSKQDYPNLGRQGCRPFPYDSYPWL